MQDKQECDVRKALAEASRDGCLPCREALALAERCDVDPRSVKRAADEMGIKIIACQLGCF